MKRPVLNPALTILTRSSGEVQVGWDPERAVLIRPPAGVATRSLAALLNHVDGTRSRAELAVTATSAGVGAAELDLMLGELAGAGLLTWASPPGLAATAAVHV